MKNVTPLYLKEVSNDCLTIIITEAKKLFFSFSDEYSLKPLGGRKSSRFY